MIWNDRYSSVLAKEDTTVMTTLFPRLELTPLLLVSALDIVAIEITVRSPGIYGSYNLLQCESCMIFGMHTIETTTVIPEILSCFELTLMLLSVRKRFVALEIVIRSQRRDVTFDLL